MAAALPSWLCIGDKALARDKAALQRMRVKYIVNATPPLTEGGVANFFPNDPAFDYHRVPIRDVATENLLPHVPSAVEFLQRARVRADGRALIHCNEGKSRSCAMAAAFLIRAYGMSTEEALDAVREARPQAQPKEAFVKQLGSLEPAKLEAEVDGFSEAPAPARTLGPSVGPAPRPAVGPSIGPARPAVAGPSVGPAPAPRADEAPSHDDAERSAKRSSIGPAPPPKRAAIGPARPRHEGGGGAS